MFKAILNFIRKLYEPKPGHCPKAIGPIRKAPTSGVMSRAARGEIRLIRLKPL